MTLKKKLQKAMDYPWCIYLTRRTRWVEKKTCVVPSPGEIVECDIPSKNSASARAGAATLDKTPT